MKVRRQSRVMDVRQLATVQTCIRTAILTRRGATRKVKDEDTITTHHHVARNSIGAQQGTGRKLRSQDRRRASARPVFVRKREFVYQQRWAWLRFRHRLKIQKYWRYEQTADIQIFSIAGKLNLAPTTQLSRGCFDMWRSLATF